MTSRGRALLAVASLLPLASPLVARQTVPDQTPGVSAYLLVVASRLNLRERPTLDAPVVGSVERGEVLCLVAYDGDWAEVLTPSGAGRPAERTTAFVSRGFLSERRASPEQLADVGCLPDRGAEPSHTPQSSGHRRYFTEF